MNPNNNTHTNTLLINARGHDCEANSCRCGREKTLVETTSLIWLYTSSFSNCLPAVLPQNCLQRFHLSWHVWECTVIHTYLWGAQGWMGYSGTTSSSCCAPQLQEEKYTHTHKQVNSTAEVNKYYIKIIISIKNYNNYNIMYSPCLTWVLVVFHGLKRWANSWRERDET